MEQPVTDHPLRVLLVEDEISLRDPLAKHLRREHGYGVDAAADLQEARSLLAQVERPYDVALIDDLLAPAPKEEPEYVGIALLREIKERWPETEVIIFTGWGMERALEALQAGAYRYLAKPLNLDELGMTIRMAAEQARLRRERDLLSATLKISRAMLSELNIGKTLEVIVEAVPKLVGAQACAVASIDSVTGRLRYGPTVPLGDVTVRWRRHLRDVGLTKRMIETGEVFALSDVDAYTDEVDKNLHRAGVKSFIGVPIPGKSQNLGVLYAYSTRREAFGAHEQQVLHLLAGQAAIALENAQLFQEVTEAGAHLQALYKASSAIISPRDPGQVLQAIVETACEALKGWRAVVVLIDEDDRPHQLAMVGFREQPEVTTSVRLAGISMKVMQSGEPYLIEDVRSQADAVHPGMVASGVGAAVCFPLRLRDKSIGVMWMHYREPRHFPQAEIEALGLYANQAAIAYDNARRMRELEHMRRAGERLASVASVQEVLQQIVQSVREVLGADSAVIWSYDTVRKTLLPDELVADGIQSELVERFREDEPRPGDTAEMLMRQKYLAVSDVDDPKYAFLDPTARGLRGTISAKAFQGIALHVGEETLGVLYVDYKQPRSFNDEDRATLETFAYHAALTLKKARLLEQVSKARDTAKVVAEVSVLEDLRSTLNSIARGTQDALHCDAVTLYTYDQSRDEFRFPPAMAGVRDTGEVLKLGFVARESVIRRILALDETYVAEDAPSDPPMGGGFVKREHIKASVGIPLKVADRKVGVMFVNYRSPHRFTGEELTNIELFANQAAVAIRNAQLYEETVRRATALQALYEAGKAITSTLALDEILHHIVEQAWRFTSRYGETARFSYIALVEGSMLKVKAGYPPEHLPGLQRAVGDIDLEHDERIGVSSRAVKTGQSQLASDVTHDPDYIEYDSETHSELAVPINLGGKVIGVINVEHPNYNAFDEDDQRALESLAAQAAIAIQNARQYEELRRTKGLVGARTALAWMGMAGSVWGHAIGGHALTIREQTQLLRKDLQRSLPREGYAMIEKRLDMIKHLAERVLEKPIIPPLSAEEGVALIVVNDLIGEQARQLWQNEPYKNTKLQLDLRLDRVATVRASPEWLRRAFDILVDNAVEAVVGCEVREITIRTREVDERAEVVISDTGPGIPEEVRVKLFWEPIERPEGAKGLGMGLLMAQAIVQTYGGDILLESTGPMGTTVVIWLPLAA